VKRASLDEDEHIRDESTPGKWLQTAISTTKLTHPIRLAHFHSFTRAYFLKNAHNLASLGAVCRVREWRLRVCLGPGAIRV